MGIGYWIYWVQSVDSTQKSPQAQTSVFCSRELAECIFQKSRKSPLVRKAGLFSWALSVALFDLSLLGVCLSEKRERVDRWELADSLDLCWARKGLWVWGFNPFGQGLVRIVCSLAYLQLWKENGIQTQHKAAFVGLPDANVFFSDKNQKTKNRLSSVI